MTASKRRIKAEQEVLSLYGELVANERQAASLAIALRTSERRREEENAAAKTVIGHLKIDAAKAIAEGRAAAKSARRETLMQLDGYLMALSEIGNDRDQGRSNQLRGGEDQPQAGQDGDHPDLGHPPE
jgi:hypothetical protein